MGECIPNSEIRKGCDAERSTWAMGECIPNSEIRKGMQCDDRRRPQRADDASIGGPAAEGGGVLEAWGAKFMVELPNQ